MMKKGILERKELYQVVIAIIFFYITYGLPWHEIVFSILNSELRLVSKESLLPIAIIPFIVFGNMIPRKSFKAFGLVTLFSFSSMGLSNILIMITPRLLGIQISNLKQLALIVSYLLFEFNFFSSPICSILILTFILSFESIKSGNLKDNEMLFRLMILVQVFSMSVLVDLNNYISYFFIGASLVTACVSLEKKSKNQISRTELFLAFSLVFLNSSVGLVAKIFVLVLALIPYPSVFVRKNYEETGVVTVIAILYIFICLAFVKAQTSYYSIILFILILIKSKDLMYKFKVISNDNKLSLLMVTFIVFGTLEYLIGAQ